MVVITNFITSDIERIKERGNLTNEERKLLDLRNQERTLEECAEIMCCSVSTVNRISKRLNTKIRKVMWY